MILPSIVYDGLTTNVHTEVFIMQMKQQYTFHSPCVSHKANAEVLIRRSLRIKKGNWDKEKWAVLISKDESTITMYGMHFNVTRQCHPKEQIDSYLIFHVTHEDLNIKLDLAYTNIGKLNWQFYTKFYKHKENSG